MLWFSSFNGDSPCQDVHRASATHLFRLSEGHTVTKVPGWGFPSTLTDEHQTVVYKVKY